MNTNPVISANGIYLREFVSEDIPDVISIYGNEEVMRYIGLGGPLQEKGIRDMINSFIRSYGKNGFGIWACVDCSTDKIIGHCGFNILPGGEETEIAYLLDRPWWGMGIAGNVAKQTLRYGFEDLNMEKIVALAYRENKASIRVIEKLGMNAEGEKEYFGKKFLYFTKFRDDDNIAK